MIPYTRTPAPSPGDIGFSHNRGLMARLIRLGEWLKGHGSEWNHQFIVSDQVDVDGCPFVIQATLRGVTGTARLDMVAPKGGKYVTMWPPQGVNRDRVLEFGKKQVGIKYSWLTILADAIDILTWNWVPALMNSYRPSWTCSGLVMEALRYGGYLHEWTNIYQVTPQMGYDALTAGQVL